MHRLSIRTAVVCAALLAEALADSRAHADETIVIEDAAPDTVARDRERALGDAPFVTVLHPDEHGATATVADAAATAPGVQLRSLGGLGAYQSLSIRGAAPGQTAVLVDGVPLARLAEVTTDLGRFALDAFGRVDVYRGAVPLELGGAGVGGAVDLVTRLGRGEHGEIVSASAGLGSYGARHLRVHYGDAYGAADDARALRSSVTLGYTGATGDYRYFDNHDTPLNPSDDGYATRTNNGFDQIDGAARLGTADATTVGGARVAYRRQGLPGATSRPTLTARLATLDAIGDAHLARDLGAATTTNLAYVLVERQHLDDTMGELGLGDVRRSSTTISGGAATTWSARLGAHRGVLGAELRGDRFRDADDQAATPTVTGTRVGGALLAQVDLAPTAGLVITPAVRLDAVRTNPAALTVGPMAFAPVDARTDLVPSPRLAARALLGDDVALKGSAGYYVRLPTLVELFGNRGFILGAPDLRAERGPNADAGIVWSPAGAVAGGWVDRVLVEADAFATRAKDTISFVTTAGYVTRAANLGRTQTYGAELAASARVARTLALTASYTRLATTQVSDDVTLDGRALPRAPGHRLYARADVGRRVLARDARAWVDLAYQSTAYLDPANLARVPGRALVGAGASCELGGGLAVAVAVENLADTRVVNVPLVPAPSPTFTTTPTALADLGGFPLPGRSVYVSVHWMY